MPPDTTRRRSRHLRPRTNRTMASASSCCWPWARHGMRRGGAAGRSPGDGETRPGAVLALAGVRGEWGFVDERVKGLLEEALGALGEEDSALRALLLSRQATELWFSGRPEPAGGPSRESVQGGR